MGKHFLISLKAARVNAEISQGEVAKVLGVSVSTIINWENGKTIPDALQFSKMTHMYGISMDCIRFS